VTAAGVVDEDVEAAERLTAAVTNGSALRGW
jgi:hypothetical protein